MTGDWQNHDLQSPVPFDPEHQEYLAYGRIAEEVEGCLAVGLQPNVQMLVSKFPEIEQQVRELFPTLTALYQLGHEPDPPEPPQPVAAAEEASAFGTLGDFRIIREVGRGGMGIVYEAEQISLSRRVALKVLPFAAVLDQRQLQRFKNEAQAAAALHHEHIVPVYSVGCERGVHYYAMQYIEGQNLSQAVAELRHLSGLEPDGDHRSIGLSSRFTERIGVEPGGPPAESERSRPRPDVSGTETRPIGGLSTERLLTRDPAYFRTVAELGMQAAEALEFAHQRGIVHRDIKPSNLMLDADCKLWITDFGLARFESDTGLTVSGDFLGTLRYMSPEQTWGKQGLVDHRSDVYSLGATLYELLTLEPTLPGNDRQELLRNRESTDPVPPRSINKAIPAELETIVLKAIAKAPGNRYASAKDLADDLRRFIKDQPILARPPRLAARAAQWLRRHKAVAGSTVAVLVAGIVFAAGIIVAQRDPTGWPNANGNGQVASQPGLAPAGENKLDRRADAAAGGPVNVPATPAGDEPPPDPEAARKAEPSVAMVPVDELNDRRPAPPIAGNETELPAVAPRPAEAAPQAADAEQMKPKATNPPPPRFASDAAKARYIAQLRDMFECGYERSRSGLEEATSHMQAARRLCSDDPRLDYGYALVLLKHFKNDEALERFRSASEQHRYPYLPAWMAIVKHQLAKKEYDAAARQLVELGKVLESSDTDWPDEPTKLVCARWMGRIVGALAVLRRSAHSAAVLKKQHDFIRGLLAEERLAAYELGGQAARKNIAVLTEANEQHRREFEKQQAKSTEQALDRIAKRADEVRGKQDKLQMNAEKWKKWLDKQTADFEKKLSDLEKEFGDLDAQAKSLRSSMLLLEQEIVERGQEQMERELQNALMGRAPVADPGLSAAIQQCYEQMRLYRQQYAVVERRAGGVRQRAGVLTAEHQADVRNYQKATGELVKKNQTLQRWQQRLGNETQDAKQGTDPDAAQRRSIADRAKLLRLYFRLDLEEEKRRVLDSYTSL